MKRLRFFIVVSLLLQCVVAHSDEPEEESLYDKILAMDTLLFNAFNDRDLKTTKEIFDPDLEFYHDEGGVSDYDQAIENSRRLFEANTGLTRELIVESLYVYPIVGYGAIQVGKHRFCHPENGEMDCGVFDFLHIWKESNDAWTLTRVVSYSH
ncbi:MAG: nuclear transport factor 2 family protein [Woeseiaceae bacterium]|nr:nuclear transport factor 2 family protein [Woeseiaceae bacterium]